MTVDLWWMDPDVFGVDDSASYYEPSIKTLDIDDACEIYDLFRRFGLEWKWDVPEQKTATA